MCSAARQKDLKLKSEISNGSLLSCLYFQSIEILLLMVLNKIVLDKNVLYNLK